MELPISEMLAHLSNVAKQHEADGKPYKCVALMFVDQDESWAGAVGGEARFDLAKLLLTARDDLVRGGDGFTVFYKPDDAANDAVTLNGHDSSKDAH